MVWRCMDSDGHIVNVTQDALVENKETRKMLVEQGLLVESRKPKEKKVKKKREKKKKDKEHKKRRHEQKKLRNQESLKAYETKSVTKQLSEVNNMDFLSKDKMDARQEKKKVEREKTEFKPDTANREAAFSDKGKIDKHVPLELVDFVGQPPFKYNTDKLMVLVRWKHDEKGNYQPTDSEVDYYALRARYERLLIELFVKKTQLTRY